MFGSLQYSLKIHINRCITKLSLFLIVLLYLLQNEKYPHLSPTPTFLLLLHYHLLLLLTLLSLLLMLLSLASVHTFNGPDEHVVARTAHTNPPRRLFGS